MAWSLNSLLHVSPPQQNQPVFTSSSNNKPKYPTTNIPFKHSLPIHTTKARPRNYLSVTSCTKTEDIELNSPKQQQPNDGLGLDCVGTGLNVECTVNTETNNSTTQLPKTTRIEGGGGEVKRRSNGDGGGLVEMVVETGVLVSPFFFWGTAMVAMKEVLPLTGPFFVSAFRLIPAGLLLVAFAVFKGRPLPSGFDAWVSIALFGLVDAACFQGFLAEGLQRTSAGLGSVRFCPYPFDFPFGLIYRALR